MSIHSRFLTLSIKEQVCLTIFLLTVFSVLVILCLPCSFSYEILREDYKKKKRFFYNEYKEYIEACFYYQGYNLLKYEEIIKEQHGELFTDHNVIKEQLCTWQDTYDASPVLVPCHNDTVPENFLVSMTTGDAYLIDWEYAGMNSLYWDIAGYILESRLPAFAIDYLLQHYFQRPVSDDELMKIKISMLEQDFLWTNWALIRHYNGDDFLDYCAFRYERLRKNMDLLKEDMHADLKNLVL